MEIWKPCPHFYLYEVSSHGRVRSKDRIIKKKSGMSKRHIDYVYNGKILDGWICPTTGYPRVSLREDLKTKIIMKSVHSLVCEAFHGEPPSPEHTVDHKDGVRTNNFYKNLRWATHSEQRHTQKQLGTLSAGDKHYLSVIPDADIPLIRKECVPRCKEHGANAIAKRYNVTRQCVSRILRGVSRAA